jgi:uncharacterized protein YdgA (DUF945 family)
MRARKLSILFGAIVALSATAPGLLGMQAQKQYDRYVDQLEGAGYRLADRSYTRGWFSSDASFTAYLPLPADTDAQPPPLHFRSRIAHGPFLGAPEPFGLARVDSELRLGDIPLLVGDDRAPMRTVVGFRGNIHGILDMAPRTAALEEGAITLESGPVTGELRLSADRSTTDGHLRVPSLRLSGSEGESAVLSSLYLRVGVRRSASGLALGEWYLTVESLAGGQGAEMVRMEGLEFAARSDEQDGLVSGSADYRLGRVALAGETYGPFDFRLAVSRFAADALARIQQAAEDVAGAGEEMKAQAMGIALLANADALLAHDPAIALERLQLDTPDGRVDGKFEVRAAGLRIAEMKDAQTALRRVEGSASLRVPEKIMAAMFRQQALQQLAAQAEEDGNVDLQSLEPAAAEFATQQIASLVAQEVLVREGGHLAAAAQWRNGLLTVNGKTIPLTLPSPGKP